MMDRFLTCAALILITVWTAAAQDNTQDKRIEELIRRLGSEDFRDREEADRLLREMGESAIEPLKKALDSEDLEVRERAEGILKHIRSKGKPPPPKEAPEGAPFRIYVVIRTGEDGYELKIGPDLIELKLDKSGKTYRAENEEDFKKKYPDIYEKYVKGRMVRMRFGAARKEPTAKEQVEEGLAKLREMLKEVEDLLKKLEDPGEFEPDDWPDLGKQLEDWMGRMEKEREELDRLTRRWKEESVQKKAPDPPGEQGNGTRLGLLMEPLGQEEAKKFGLREGEGVRILKVYGDTPASRLGLLKGDVLHRINGRVIANALQARVEFSRALEGEKVRIEIIRDGKEETLSGVCEDLHD